MHFEADGAAGGRPERIKAQLVGNAREPDLLVPRLIVARALAAVMASTIWIPTSIIPATMSWRGRAIP
jgi:hypothetical protein